MKIDITSRNYRVSDRLKGLIDKKLSKFDKFFDKPATVKVVCSMVKDRYKMELSLNAGSMFIRSEVETDNMYSNLDVCVAKLEKQVIKFLGKANVKAKAIDFSELEYFDELPELVIPKITKRKSFNLVPMSEQEALIQMDLVGNDFFIFMNSATEIFEEIYRKPPMNVAFCPYRICPIGAHSDHQLGKITGFAINRKTGIHVLFKGSH